MSTTLKHSILAAVCVAAVVAAILAPRIAQDPLYHQFADQNSLLSIPHTLNVLTNLLFAWVGFEGFYRLARQQSMYLERKIYSAYLSFFAALVLIAAGSGYYHWSPDNESLVWDRLPMTIAFMSFFSIMFAERISTQVAKMLFPVLLLAGLSSIAYWHYSELAGRGDLRPYALVQFLPVLLIPFILLMFDSRYTRSSDIWWLLVWFLVSKVCEALDREIYDWLILLSGHSLKHIAAGIGCLVFLRHLRLRVPVQR